MEKELSVVIPTYNEKDNLRILIPKVLDVFKENKLDGEIIVVDDRSRDGSFEYLNGLAKAVPELKVIFRNPPPSISRAWYEGFDAARKKNIVCIDADLCHDPKYFPEMLRKMENFDIVIGSRYMDKGFGTMKGKSLFAVYLSIISQFITRAATGFTERDISHSFRMFKKNVFDGIKAKLKKQGNIFLIEFMYYAKKNGAKVTEIPIEYGKRIHGITKLKISKEGFRYLGFIAEILFKSLFRI